MGETLKKERKMMYFIWTILITVYLERKSESFFLFIFSFLYDSF